MRQVNHNTKPLERGTMWTALGSVRAKVSSNPEDYVCVLIDAGVSEWLKWKSLHRHENIAPGSCFPNDIVLDFPSISDETRQILKSQRPDKFIFWLSFVSLQLVTKIKNFMSTIECFSCTIVSHLNDASMSVALGCEDSGSDYLIRLLNPVVPSLLYTPTFSFSILPESSNETVDVRIITSHRDRTIHPLSLSAISENYQSLEQKCIYELNAADLSTSIKQSLKQLAHNVAGTVACELGCDVMDSMFAIGKTSSLVGHSVLSMLEAYNDIRTGKNIEQSSRFIDMKKVTTSNSRSSMSLGSLILVDRLEDLFTPIIQGGEQPVFHRVLNAIKMDSLQISDYQTSEESGNAVGKTDEFAVKSVLVDISLQPEWCSSLKDIDNVINPDETASIIPVALPMNAMSTLAVHAVPSLCYSPASSSASSNSSSLILELMAGAEEQGRGLLVDVLKQSITLEKGSLPPAKKRGIGAEILALVQSLIKAPGQDSSKSMLGTGETEPSIGTITRSQSLLSLSLTIIETMQRSSAKQFSTVCSWKAALDTRIAREADWVKVLQESSDEDAFIANSAALIQRPLHRNTRREDINIDGPVDVSHILLLAIGIIGFMRFKQAGTEYLQDLSNALSRHLLFYASDEELRYLRRLGVVTQDFEDIIAEVRFEGLTEDAAESTLVSASALIMKKFSILQELQVMYTHVWNRIVAKKVAETRNIPWDSNTNTSIIDHNRQAQAVLAGTYELQYLRDLIKPDAPGLLAKLLEDCVLYHRTHESSPLSLLFEHIQSPFQKMKNTGLELLSKGLGSFGFGLSRVVKAATEAPHPGSYKTIVIFVVGGITYKEVAQVRAMLEKYQSSDQGDESWRIILLSNKTICSEEIISSLFQPI